MLTASPDGRSAWFCCPCETYRYRLGRKWGDDSWPPPVTFVMLNPSTADHRADDPTIRRCIGFARSWGYSRLVVVNLYGLRSTDPRALRLARDPVGPDNDAHVADAASVADHFDAPLVAAWGVNAAPERVEQVLSLPHMDRLTALGTTKSGAPRHPLYMRADAALTPYRQEA